MKVSINGKIVDEKEAVISIFDHGFLYGMGLFETFRTYNGNPFLLEEHLRRLKESCSMIGLKWEYDKKRVLQQIKVLLMSNNLKEGYIRYTVTAGVGHVGLPVNSYDTYNEIIYVKSLSAPNDNLYENGKAIQLLNIPRNTPESGIRLKSLHYMNNILGKKEINETAQDKTAEGLFLTSEGFLAEGIVSNLFFVKDQVSYTPSIDTGILPGVTRANIISKLRKLGIEVIEGHFKWEDLISADEIFITNSIQEIVPITTLYDLNGNEIKVGSGQAGSKTKEWIKDYRMATGGYE
ncbi:aminodeoxychorismate lyase [Chengkuizengella axinellae]|uniref:Aminodeoxychorismate lyase n=1 Tax=Chengkuizengella axinellae TaxID=3064388 RepID=A0ABT9J5S7_9BACL|nr:aminodeoxychorismate lyase [Chengkuizengella sp. 2205SS18-9]MDP5276972.1 aminodeoxychorismate lyase [Chengkuizengella sp. 2205SS18-9]